MANASASNHHSNTICLRSSEGKLMNVDRSIVTLSDTISGMINDLGDEVDFADGIPIPVVNCETLSRVVRWCAHHKANPPELIVSDAKGGQYDILMTDWDNDFFHLGLPDLYEVILAANYLSIKGLLYQGCKFIADNFIRDKTVGEVREAFGLEHGFTDEDLVQLQKEYDWSEKE